MKLSYRHLVILALLCVVLLGVVVVVLYTEYDRPWKTYQQQFRQLSLSMSAQGSRPGIRQIWNRDPNKADRCVTCHEGIDDPLYINEQQPFKTHSGDYLRYHPVEKFGCISCHEGQGPALTADAAHGKVKNWARPVLRGPFAQASCRKCHALEQLLQADPEMNGASTLIDGWNLFLGYNCSGCHRISEFKKPERIGPALTLIGDKVSRTWLVNWLKDPKSYLPKTRMPRFTLRDDEIGYIADYLLSLNATQHGAVRRSVEALINMNPINEGKQLVGDLGCLGCHRINDTGNDFAPAFSGLGNKVRPEWVISFLKDPKGYDPKTIMPALQIEDRDILKIAEYLMSLKRGIDGLSYIYDPSYPGSRGQGGEGKPSQSSIEKGRRLVKDLGCTGCHEIEKLPSIYNAPDLDALGDKKVGELVFGNADTGEKSLSTWLKIKVTDPGRFATDRIVTRMPNYDFDEGQATALVTFLLSLRKDPAPEGHKMTFADFNNARYQGTTLVEKYNCTGCHTINNKGGTTGPELTQEGRRSRPEWLFTFLKKPHKIRPLPVLKAGMPDFNLSDNEVNTIIEYLSLVSETPYPYNFEPGLAINPEDIWNGEKLYQEIFACSGCHTIDGHGGQVGPDHTDLASRMKREWIEQWLLNPQLVVPDARMPRFAFKDWEFKALTNYLMTLGKQRFVSLKKD